MRKFIPALLFMASLPALVIAAPADQGYHQSTSGHRGGSMNCDQKGGGHGFNKHRGDNHAMGGMSNLSVEQREKMRETMREQSQKRSDINQQYYNKLSDADKKAMEAELQKTREETRTKMRAILTPEQQKTFDENQKRNEEKMTEWQEFQQWKANKAAK